MSGDILQYTQPSEATQSNFSTAGRTLFRLFRELVAVLFWTYAIVKLFLFDLDIYLVNAIDPALAWMLYYKFLFFIAIIAIVAIFVSRWSALWLCAFIALYPFILLFWRLPYFIFRHKSWLLLFHVINTLVSFFQSFRYRVLSMSLFLIAFTFSIVSSNPLILTASIFLLLAIVSLTFIRTFWNILRPSALFGLYKKGFSWVSTTYLQEMRERESVRGIPVASMTDAQLSVYKTQLGSSVLVNRLLLFAARRLRDYQNSVIGVFGGIMLFLFLWGYMVLSFSAVNYALFKIRPGEFGVTGSPTFFGFFRYSFYANFFAGIAEIVPVSVLSQSIAMLAVLFGVITLVIFAGVMIATMNSKYTIQLNDLISNAEREGRVAERFISSEYGLASIDDAMTELQRLKSELISFLLLVSKNLQ